MNDTQQHIAEWIFQRHKEKDLVTKDNIFAHHDMLDYNDMDVHTAYKYLIDQSIIIPEGKEHYMTRLNNKVKEAKTYEKAERNLSVTWIDFIKKEAVRRIVYIIIGAGGGIIGWLIGWLSC